MRKKRVVTLAMGKGGVGKSTSALGLALAAKAADPELSVWVVDLDPQKTSSTWISKYELPLRLLERWPKNEREEELVGWHGDELVVVDTPGLASVETAQGLRVANLVLLPCRASDMDLHAAAMTLQAISGVGVRAAWLPSQIGDKAEEVRFSQQLRAAMPSWKVMPAVRAMKTVRAFVRGERAKHASLMFDNLWTVVKQDLRLT